MRPFGVPSPSPPVEPFRDLRDAVSAVIRGKQEVIDLAVIALLAGGHLLLEDIPGVGKSTLARTLALAVGGSFRRIQFTSDLLPADLVGTTMYRTREERFEFRPGPVFANFVLADELNRAPPRTQSALLEAMGEGQVSVDGTTHALPDPFMVLATQNPIEHHGTYPLPESQRDRFLLCVALGYTDAEIEAELLRSGPEPTVRTAADAVTDLSRIHAAKAEVRAVTVHADVARYAQRVVAATRRHGAIQLGVSTRGALGWMAAARARAYLCDRTHVALDDLQELAVPALSHRIVLGQAAATSARSAAEVVREVLAGVAVPV